MRETYGELKLPKGFILYHTTENEFIKRSEEEYPILFCVLHPSEFDRENIVKIILKKEISLFFAIDFKIRDEKKAIPVCVMKKITNTDLFIRYVSIVRDYLLFFSENLKKNNFEGWYGLQKINNGNTEIALINNPDIFDIEIDNQTKDWKREAINRETGIPRQKIWGNNFPINIDKKVIITLNERYKDKIELFMKNMNDDKYKYNKCLQILLSNSEIIYKNGIEKEIIWNVEHLDDQGLRLIDRYLFLT
jgi:hypothetical protein